MKSTFESIVAAALALALALCGYGAAFPDHATFRPRVTHDVDFAIGVNLDKEQAFKVVDAYADLVLDIGEFNDREIAEAKGKIAAFKEDPFRDAPESMRSFLERSGLRNAEYRWAVLSLTDFKMMDGKPSLGGISLALAGTIDLDKLISACRQEDDCDAIFEKTQVEDETAWHIVPEKAKDVREMKELHIDPYVTSLDGRLVLAATSRETLARQIRLYRSGSGKGDALDGFSASDGELVHLHLSDIGGILRKYVPRHNLKKLNFIRGGDELALGLEYLDVSLNVTSNGVLRDTLRLVTASEKDAHTLRSLAKMGIGILGIMMLNDQKSKEPEAANLAKKKFFGKIQVGGTGRQLEIRGGSLLVVVAVSSARLSANLSTMAMQGSKLVTGIIQANVEREGKLGPVWPRTELADGAAVAGDKDDVAGRAYGSATEYFNALFDMKRYGQAEWDPCVDGELLPALWGCGVSTMNGRTLEKRNVAWIVAANVTDETPDFMPVLITANFNPALLLRKWDGMTKGSEKLPIGPKSGAQETPFGDKGIVIVRKSGAAETVKKKDLTYNVLYKKQAFDLTKMKPPLMYLTPGGVVEPRECVGALVPGGAPSKEWLNLMACFLAEKGQKERSREMYLKVLEKDAANYDALMGLWRLSLQEGATDEARSYLKKAEKAKTREGVERLEVPLQYMMDNNLDEAHEALKRIVFQHPSVRVWALDAGVMLQLADTAKDPAEKQRILAEVENGILPKMEQLSDSPRDFYVQMTRTLVLMRKGSDPETLTKARDALEDAWQSRPTVAVGGMVLDLDYRLLDRESAERHAKQILRLADDHSFANWVMGSIRMNEGKNPEAERYLRASAQAAHPLPAAQNDLAELLRRRGNLAEAEKFARAATKSDPNLYVAWDTLATTLLDRGKDLDEAEQCIQKAIELSEDSDLRMQLTLARVQLAKKDFAKARNALRVLDKRRAELEERDRAVLDELQRQVREINGLKSKEKKKQ